MVSTAASEGVKYASLALQGLAKTPRANPSGPERIVAVSEFRYRATPAQKRLYGGSTVTQFIVHHEGQQDYTRVMGYGRTPGERKTDAIRRFLEMAR